MEQTTDAIHTTLARIEHAAQRSGQSAEQITLIAVSKQKPMADIIKAYEAGIRHFGENRCDELEKKAHALSHLKDINWHFIGQLQSRQVKTVAEYAHFFHALDRVKIANSLSDKLLTFNRTLPVFIQVNVSGEETKSGFNCEHWQQDKQQINDLISAIQQIMQLPRLRVLGLMTMAPFNAPEEDLRKIFRRMADLSGYLKENLNDPAISCLSMGMSGDFEIAIEEGATHVRIGSAIFGTRAV